MDAIDNTNFLKVETICKEAREDNSLIAVLAGASQAERYVAICKYLGVRALMTDAALNTAEPALISRHLRRLIKGWALLHGFRDAAFHQFGGFLGLRFQVDNGVALYFLTRVKDKRMDADPLLNVMLQFAIRWSLK
jgi:hypothetical protein